MNCIKKDCNEPAAILFLRRYYLFDKLAKIGEEETQYGYCKGHWMEIEESQKKEEKKEVKE